MESRTFPNLKGVPPDQPILITRDPYDSLEYRSDFTEGLTAPTELAPAAEGALRAPREWRVKNPGASPLARPSSA